MPASAGQHDAVDVLIVGAGISGIGAAYYLRRDHPQRSYAILEARGASGGTWDLFRYPGVRSDSDLHTFGYEFRPWRSDVAIARAEDILGYLRETAAAYGIDRDIRFHRRVAAASWSSEDARWTVEVEHTDTGERSVVKCNWIVCAAGYYRYDAGYTPHFEGLERFGGPVVHPQHWPADLDYAGKRVVVIGSGATAVTLVPAMAKTAASVTMVQRTPSYVVTLPSRDTLAARLSALLGEERGFALTRRMNILRQEGFWWFCQRYPARARRLIRRLNERLLPAGYPVDEHFNPPYNPWDQRLCVAADADLFRAIRSGKADVVTDHIETFTENGLKMKSGRELPADLIVTATGLKVQTLGGISLTVDGQPLHFSDTVTFKGMMASGVPNLAYVFGYTNASWTLKVGPLCEHFGRLLSYMDDHGYDTARPVMADSSMATKPFLDFGAGYIQRSIGELPRQGNRTPWLRPNTYHGDVRLLRHRSVADPELRFSASRKLPHGSGLPAVEIAQQGDLRAVVNGLAVDVQHERAHRVLGERALRRAARASETFGVKPADARLPGRVDGVEPGERGGRVAGIVVFLVLHRRAAEMRRDPHAEHADQQVAHSPGDGRGRRRVGRRPCPVHREVPGPQGDRCGGPAARPDRPHAGRRLPEILLGGETVQPRAELVPPVPVELLGQFLGPFDARGATHKPTLSS